MGRSAALALFLGCSTVFVLGIFWGPFQPSARKRPGRTAPPAAIGTQDGLAALLPTGEPEKPRRPREAGRTSRYAPVPAPVQATSPMTEAGWRPALRARLGKAGWDQQAIDALLGLNEEWFAEVSASSAERYEDQAHALEGLGGKRASLSLLRKHPEVAGLLASARDPEDLARLLDDASADQRLILLGLFARNVARNDVSALCRGLRDNRERACQLIDKGMVGGEALFLFSREGPGAAEYEAWLQESLDSRLGGKEEELAAFVQFVQSQGRDLLAKLDEDEPFRHRFRESLWPRLLRACARSKEPIEFYLDDPNLWKLLALDQGEELLEKRGLMAAAMLFGPDAHSKERFASVIPVLLAGNGATFEALTEGKFRKDPRFYSMLEQELAPGLLAAATNKLLDKKDEFGATLDSYERLARTNRAALEEEVGPSPEGVQTWLPLYNQFMLARKLWQGRDTTTEEWMEAGIDTAMDAASLLFPPAKVAGKAGTAAGGKVLAHSMRKSALATARRMPGKAAQLLARKGAERQVVRVGLTGALAGMQRDLAKSVSRAATVEITGPVRFFYRNSGLSRESFKRLTSLDARLFLRRDGMVHVHLDRAARRTAEWYINKCGENLREKAGEEAAKLCRKNLAAWWLLNTSEAKEGKKE